MHENPNSPKHKSESKKKCPNLFAPRACAFSGLHSRNPSGPGPVNGIEELESSQGTCPTAKIDHFLLKTYHWKSLLRCHRAGWTSVACVACKGHIEGKGNQGEHRKTIEMISQWIDTLNDSKSRIWVMFLRYMALQVLSIGLGCWETCGSTSWLPQRILNDQPRKLGQTHLHFPAPPWAVTVEDGFPLI